MTTETEFDLDAKNREHRINQSSANFAKITLDSVAPQDDSISIANVQQELPQPEHSVFSDTYGAIEYARDLDKKRNK